MESTRDYIRLVAMKWKLLKICIIIIFNLAAVKSLNNPQPFANKVFRHISGMFGSFGRSNTTSPFVHKQPRIKSIANRRLQVSLNQ